MIKIYSGSMTGKERAALKTFSFSDDLFCEIGSYVFDSNPNDGTCFAVVDKNGNDMFCVIYLEDRITGIKRKDLSDYYDRFQNHADDLDFTLIEKFETFIFLEVDDYSIAVAKLLLAHYPNKKVIFGDKRAAYFLDGKQVKYLRRLHNAGHCMERTEAWMRGENGSAADRIRAFVGWKWLGYLKEKGTCCIVKADRRNHPDEEGVVYNSQNVMYSILWKKMERSLGEGVKNVDKEIIVLDYPCDKEGLGSITKCAFAHIKWMRQNGYVPVMDLHVFPNQYLNAEGENMWEYFFEPVSSVTVEEAYQSRNVILASENDISWCDFHISPYQRKYMNTLAYRQEFAETVRFNKDTRDHIESRMPKEIKDGRRILGAVARGTDFRSTAAVKTNKVWRQNVVEIDKFMEVCERYREILCCDYIFLATEDAEYLELFQKRFGEKLIFVSQDRVAYDYENNDFKSVSELFAAKNEKRDGRKAGRDYLSVIHCLTECKALLYNVECGAVRMARDWKRDSYELIRCVKAE